MTVVDMTTGEIVAQVPSIPAPNTPITVAQIAHQCRSLEVWAEQCDSIDELKDADNKLAAIGEYLSRTNTEGRQKVEATRRRLEVRIGELLGPAKVGSHSSAIEGAELTADERSQFRKMADHPDIVEAVIDESTDETPSSRRRTIDEINRARSKPPTEEEVRAAEHKAFIQRSARRLEKFLDGFDQFIGLGSHPHRQEILDAMETEDRNRLLSIETELFK